MLVDIQIFVVIISIMGALLGIPYFLVYLTKREDRHWNQSVEYYLNTKGSRRFYDSFSMLPFILLISSGVINSFFIEFILGLAFAFFYIYILVSTEVIKSQAKRLILLGKMFAVWLFLLVVGIFTDELKIITYFWAIVLGGYGGFKLHEARILHIYQFKIG